MRSRRLPTIGVAIVAAVMLTVAAAPLIGNSADHLDAPGLTSPEGRLDADINDVYVFEGSDDSNTVIAVTTHPAAGAIAPLKYAKDVKYKVNVDQDGDALEDLAYVWRFGKGKAGKQRYKVRRYEGAGARSLTDGTQIAVGRMGKTKRVAGGGRTFVDLRSDPFFFDLDAFRGAVLGQDVERTFCDQAGGAGIDFFAALNTNAIVLEVPDGALGDAIGVWATTVGEDGQIDRMGRPAINTVFNSGANKNAFNAGQPRDDLDVFGENAAAVLETFSGLDSEGAYTDEQIDTIVGLLFPDMVTYMTNSPAQGPLNGRALADDVIDAELNIVTGGLDFGGERDTAGAIPSDCVAAHTDLQSTFPYLGTPH
ncbi:MAG: DUF4331 family protein [Actinomycetota bacterium]